ncbi:MAG: hypothetical protein OEZ00_00550 [Dehalococcoidia bacterium]|nr:hypothetical protein [Dehalococcoidia bacterium]
MKTKILSILVVTAILTLCIGTTAVAAPPKSPFLEFELYGGGSRCSVGWVEDSTVLAKDAEVTWRSWGNQYKVFIPEGTELIGSPGQQTYFLEVSVNNYYPTYVNLNPRDLKFSNPVTISELIDGEWSPILTFTTIEHGIAY